MISYVLNSSELNVEYVPQYLVAAGKLVDNFIAASVPSTLTGMRTKLNKSNFLLSANGILVQRIEDDCDLLAGLILPRCDRY